MITRVSLIGGIGDALNARSFLVAYCEQKRYGRDAITIYSPNHWWMFDGMGFKRSLDRRLFRHLVPYKNFGNYDLTKLHDIDKADECIAKNAGINYRFENITSLPEYGNLDIPLPEKFITFNTGYGELSGDPTNPDYVCTKAWPIENWEKLIFMLEAAGIACVQIGSGPSSKPVQAATKSYVNLLSLQGTSMVMRKAMFHIDIEGGLVIMAQHVGRKAVVLFGPCAVENQGRSFNMNIRCTDCPPCYEWDGNRLPTLCVPKKELKCKAHCMTDIKPEYVFDRLKEKAWI